MNRKRIVVLFIGISSIFSVGVFFHFANRADFIEVDDSYDQVLDIQHAENDQLHTNDDQADVVLFKQLQELEASPNTQQENRESVSSPDSVGPSSEQVQERSVRLTEFRGEMKKAKLAIENSVDLATHPSLSWFTKDVSQMRLPDASEIRARDYFFAWVQLNPNKMNEVSQDSFAALGIEIFDGMGEYRRATLPRSEVKLRQLLESEAILAVGRMPVNDKIGPNFKEEVESSPSNDSVDVMITLMTTEKVADWMKDIEQLGGTSLYWDETIRVVVATIPYGSIFDLASRDFVQEIASVGVIKPTLDSSVSVAGADSLRSFLGVGGEFSGITGDDVTIGIIDSGLNLSHPDIYSNRESICGKNFNVDSNGYADDDDLWVDYAGHGTHVTGILAGAGVEDPSKAGVAPRVEHFRIAKMLNRENTGYLVAMLKAIDYLSEQSSCEWDSRQVPPRQPSVVNVSLGGTSQDQGYHPTAKKLDWAVWSNNQTYVVAAGNDSTTGYTEYASSKNALPVGWLTDANFVHLSSSRGPTTDGRLMPKVSVSGTSVSSAQGNGSQGGYEIWSGTSMASPAVAGVVTLLMDVDDEFKENPALVRAQIMATAIKPDPYYANEQLSPLNHTEGPDFITNRYGLGVVSARTAVTQGPNDEWRSQSAISELEDNEYAYIEIDVPQNTARFDVVLTWDEPPNDNVGQPVVADLDLYYGPDSNCDVTVCGEFVSASRTDNVEYLIISNPEAGRKRLSIVPRNIFQHKPRAAVAWVFIADSTASELDLELDTTSINTQNTRRPKLEMSVTTDGYVASGSTLYIGCRGDEVDACDYWYDFDNSRWQPGSEVTREDGTLQDLSGQYIRNAIHLGEIGPEETQEITLVFPPTIKTSSHQLYVSVASGNAMSDVEGLNVIVDTDQFDPLTQQISNDSLQNAIILAGDSGNIEVDLLAGSRTPGEWSIDFGVLAYYVINYDWSFATFDVITNGNMQSRSAWYKISTTEPAKYSVQVNRKDPANANVSFQVISASTGQTVEYLWYSNRFEFFLRPNEEYYLRVNSYWTHEVPSVAFIWQQSDAIPANDDFANRTNISNSSGDISGDISFATIEEHEPSGHIAVGSTWYSWTAPSDGVWRFSASYENSNETPTVLAYQGTSIQDLRVVSDTSYYAAVFPVEDGEVYHISVSSDSYDDYQGAYELSWNSTSDIFLADHDLFENSITLSGSEGSTRKCSSCRDRRTIEADEPVATTTHSLWWNWTAPETKSYTFRIEDSFYDTLSIFSGESLEDLNLIETGREIVVNATSDETYQIAIHRVSGLEFNYDLSNNELEWGETPEYDLISSPATLSSTTGSMTMTLKYASTTADETPANGIQSSGVHYSVWGSWSTPSSFDGWMRFSIESWEDAGLRTATDQYFLGIHERNSATDTWDLVASTDRSFIIGGRPEAFFQPVAAGEYRVQVALRSNGSSLTKSQTEVDISWEEASAPAWLSNNLKIMEFGNDSGVDMEELIDPTDGLVIGESLDKFLLHVDDQMLVLQLSEGVEDLDVLETIPYVDNLGASSSFSAASVSIWSPTREAIYSPLRQSFGLLEGYDQSDRSYAECFVEDEFSLTPTHVIIDKTGRHLYKFGQETIAVYQIDGPCELTLVQVLTSSFSPRHSKREFVVELIDLHHGVFDSTESYLYGFSNSYFLVFSRDPDTGKLALESSTRHSSWLADTEASRFTSRFNEARVALDKSQDFLFAIGWHNPAVAVFDVATDPADPKVLGAIDDYYLSSTDFFPSHIRKPSWWNWGSCNEIETHDTENPTIDVFCTYMYYVATWDKDAQQLYLSDWSSDEQPDRFGNQVPVLDDLLGSFSVSTPNNQFTYLVVDDWIDAIHRFERISGVIEPQPEEFSPYDDYILRLVAMDVEPGSIIIGSRTITDCTAFSDLEIDDVTYTVSSSKWQSRTELGAEWEDVEGQDRDDNQLCPYNPPDSLEYRLVFEATIDGTEKKFSSDVMVKPAD